LLLERERARVIILFEKETVRAHALDNIQISNFICPVNNWREREEKSRIIIKKDKEFQYN